MQQLRNIKFMKRLLIFITMLLPLIAISQMRGGTEYIDNYARLMTKKSKGPELLGSLYVIDDWHEGEIMLKEGSVKLDQIRLNMQTSNIDVLYKGEEKEIRSGDYEYVVFPSKSGICSYRPGPKFICKGKPLTGFVEIIGDDEEKILINHFNYIRKANNDAKIIGGETNDRLIRKTELYIQKAKVLTLIQTKKDVLEYYKNRSSKAEAVIKNGKLNVKEPSDLLSLLSQMAASEPEK